MAHIECPREDDVLVIAGSGRWPEAAPAELREHVASCAVCGDLAAVTAAFEREIESCEPAPLPSSGLVWWRAQLRARQEAAREVVRPITVTQALAFASVIGVAGAVFGATAGWFQNALRTFGTSVAAVASRIPLPSLPALPDDLSSVWIGHWLLLLVATAALVAGALVVGWAMKEE